MIQQSHSGEVRKVHPDRLGNQEEWREKSDFFSMVTSTASWRSCNARGRSHGAGAGSMICPVLPGPSAAPQTDIDVSLRWSLLSGPERERMMSQTRYRGGGGGVKSGVVAQGKLEKKNFSIWTSRRSPLSP